MKYLIIITFMIILCTIKADDDYLIKMGQKNVCIKGLISSFVSSQHCDKLSDDQKSKIALKMTQCLMIQMKKPLPSSCKVDQPKNCDLHGDSWSTFTTFYAHVDNLCHFYWQTLHHQKAQNLITKLSQSSDNADKILRQNSEQTKKIVQMQQKMHKSIQISLQNQQKISQIIDTSSKNLYNLTNQIDSYLKKIHRDIDDNYASLRNILNVMNQGIMKILSFQAFITAQLTSLQGMLYFLTLFFMILFVTSFKKYAQMRINVLIILVINIFLELSIHNVIQWLIGINKLRYLFILIIILSIYNGRLQESQKKQDLSKYFNTPRLKTVFQTVLQEKYADNKLKSLMSPINKKRRLIQLKYEKTY